MKLIYLDYNATTPVDPAVVAAMVPYFHERFGNPSSAHAFGYEARGALETARGQVAALIGAQPNDVIFTGGGSESDNLAIQGAVLAQLDRRPHVVSTAVEHPAVLSTLSYWQRRLDLDYTLLPVDRFGLVDPDAVRAAIRPETVLVTIVHANNEVGTLQPLVEIGKVARDAGVLFHTDAAQAAGKIQIDVQELGVDLLTVAGHKLYAPKGIGALYIRPGAQIDPLVHGSGQERGLRAGTESVALAVALGSACEIAREALPREAPRLLQLRDILHARLTDLVSGALLNGHPVRRLPNTLNISLPGAIGQDVLARAFGVAASTGAACHSGQTEPSAVLTAMGLPRDRALGALRLSLGRWTTLQDVEQAAEQLAEAYTAATLTSAALS